MLAEREVVYHVALDFEQELQMAAQSSVLEKSYGLPVGQEQAVSVSLGFVNSLDWVSSFFTSTLRYNPTVWNIVARNSKSSRPYLHQRRRKEEAMM